MSKRNNALGVFELIAIALGGMVGGGIFIVLSISVSMIGVYTPLVILIGGFIVALATYSFYIKTFLQSPFAASLIGWFVIFGYISTIAL